MTYKELYNKKYGYKQNESHNLSEISKDSNVSIKGLQQIYNKGIGAYKTNPQSVRPNVTSKEQWAMARVYSAVMGGKAAKVDANELKMKEGGELETDKTFILTTYFVSAETDTDSSNIYNGTDYERAKLEFDSANISNFDRENGNMVLFQKVIDKYKFIGDLEDGYYEISDFPIEDYYNDKDYYKIIENGEFEHIDSKDVAYVNNESDDLLHDVESYYQKTYGKWKYNKIIVDNGKDENDDDYKEYGCIQLRITNHSENVINNDKFGSCDYYISVVIANKNPTKDKFLTSMYERRRNEIEINFNSDNSFDEIIDEIDSEIANGQFYIAEKLDISVNDLYNANELKMKDGGDLSKHSEIYIKWKKLVNMSAAELKTFMDSADGKKAGLSKEQAGKLGINYGRESAKWIIKMKQTPVSQWTDKMWYWANRQISFNSRMKGNKGKLFDENGNKTRKHLSLLIWGHNPLKYADGGIINVFNYTIGGL